MNSWINSTSREQTAVMQSQPLVAEQRHQDAAQTTSSKTKSEIMSETTSAPTGGYTNKERKLLADDFDSELDDDVDEDLIDDECQESFENFVQMRTQKEEGATKRLLHFLEVVNTDIQKYFGKNKGSEDACDVYQDKWTSGKSGRELYYADLMKIAQGLDNDEPKSPPKSESSIKDEKGGARLGDVHSGKLDPSVGLGPLEGLFDCAVKGGSGIASKRSSVGKQNHHQVKRAKGIKVEDIAKRAKALPMADRKLPQSFWTEPHYISGTSPQGKHLKDNDSCMVPHGNNNNNYQRGNANKCQRRANGQTSGVDAIGQSVPPDFGDLLDCWGDVTHLSTTCPPGGPHNNHAIPTRGHTATCVSATRAIH